MRIFYKVELERDKGQSGVYNLEAKNVVSLYQKPEFPKIFD
jgi:hypothetical protein